MQRDGGIGADREEGRGAEVHIAAIAAKDVPGGGQHDELQHDVAGIEDVIVAQPQREAEGNDADRQCDEEKNRRTHATAPTNRMAGRPASAAGIRTTPPAPTTGRNTSRSSSRRWRAASPRSPCRAGSASRRARRSRTRGRYIRGRPKAPPAG